MRRTIFVHGIFGWGEIDPLWKILPYWGMATGDLMVHLRRSGYDVAAASVGPISGVWDRACELYAQLTGTRTDYGAAHAARFGHRRYGRYYENALAPDWSADHPVDLVGHSFGGTTARLLAHLLAFGSEEEKAAAPEDVSPLFTGGKAGLVKNVCCLTTPHNGSSLFEAWPGYTDLIEWIGLTASKAVGIANLRGVYDFKLDQFGMFKTEDETLSDAIRRVSAVRMPADDWAADDLRVDNALRINRTIRMVPGIRYVSVPGKRTRKKIRSAEHQPQLTMTVGLQPTASAMGRCIGRKTADGFVFDAAWAPNDGLVNTVSARCPLKDPFAIFHPGGRLLPNVWNVLPSQRLDHLEIQGGSNPLLRARIRKLYGMLMEILSSD